MAVAKYATPGSRSSNIAGTALNSIANGANTAFITYDNSSNRNLYGAVAVKLGSFTTTTGASITLRVYINDGTDVNDDTGSVGGGETYTVPLTVGASAKVVVLPMVRLYPFSMRLQVTNNGGATTASSGNELYVTPYNEDVS
jgi:hypothetical protein